MLIHNFSWYYSTNYMIPIPHIGRELTWYMGPTNRDSSTRRVA